MKRSKHDIPAENECPACRGRGYPDSTAQLIATVDEKPVTTQLGYGCLKCHGTGRLLWNTTGQH